MEATLTEMTPDGAMPPVPPGTGDPIRVLVVAGTFALASDSVADGATAPTKIRLRIGTRTLTATLAQNKTARDFVSLLPLTLSMHDLFER